MILVTGANGFVGRAVVARIERDEPGTVRAAVRNASADVPRAASVTRISDMGGDWAVPLAGVKTVIHCAARVHVMQDSAADPLSEFRRVNLDGTVHLARQAVAAGVRRFVFISSIKVNGESTSPGNPFVAAGRAQPSDAYGVSKLEAEQALRAIALDTGLEVVVIRPVLVYGPGVKGNFRSLLRWLHRGLPLPLASIHNRRSLVALDNLADLIATCARHPSAANRTFLVSDGEDLSTTELLRRTARALNRRARLLPVPASVLKAAGGLAGKGAEVNRLVGTLQVDMRDTRSTLDWSPVVSVDAALARTADAFLASRSG